MHEGKLTAELSRAEATEEAIMFAATGQTVVNAGNAGNARPKSGAKQTGNPPSQ
jgi:hypothetical protein